MEWALFCESKVEFRFWWKEKGIHFYWFEKCHMLHTKFCLMRIIWVELVLHGWRMTRDYDTNTIWILRLEILARIHYTIVECQRSGDFMTSSRKTSQVSRHPWLVKVWRIGWWQVLQQSSHGFSCLYIVYHCWDAAYFSGLLFQLHVIE